MSNLQYRMVLYQKVTNSIIMNFSFKYGYLITMPYFRNRIKEINRFRNYFLP
jgi:hypothetical protein